MKVAEQAGRCPSLCTKAQAPGIPLLCRPVPCMWPPPRGAACLLNLCRCIYIPSCASGKEKGEAGFLLKEQGPASQPCVLTCCGDRSDEAASSCGGDGRWGLYPGSPVPAWSLSSMEEGEGNRGPVMASVSATGRDSWAPVPALSWVFHHCVFTLLGLLPVLLLEMV